MRGACSFFTAFEHLEHAVRDHEPAEDIRRTEHHGDEAGHSRGGAVRRGQGKHPTQQDDAVDRVGAAHQRGVQQRGHPEDQFHAEKNRHDENEEPVTYVNEDDVKSIEHEEHVEHDENEDPVTFTYDTES